MIVGIGCDICRKDRLHSDLASKILTDREMETFNTLKETRQLEWLAGRFAAKEALIKAVGHGSLRSYEIISNDNGKPTCIVDNKKVFISISHDGDYAMAMAVIEA